MKLLALLLALAVAGLLTAQSLRRTAVVSPSVSPEPGVALPGAPASTAQAVQAQMQQALEQGAQETARRLQDAESTSK